MKCEVPGCDAASRIVTVLIEFTGSCGHTYIRSCTPEEALDLLVAGLPTAPAADPPMEKLTCEGKPVIGGEYNPSYYTRPSDLIMPFGKFKGERIEDIDEGYLTWALENLTNLSAPLREEMENQLALKSGRGVARKR
jgi:hypothetical protein